MQLLICGEHNLQLLDLSCSRHSRTNSNETLALERGFYPNLRPLSPWEIKFESNPPSMPSALCPFLPCSAFCCTYSLLLLFTACYCPLPLYCLYCLFCLLRTFTALYCPLSAFTALFSLFLLCYCLYIALTALYCFLLPPYPLPPCCLLLPFTALFCALLPFTARAFSLNPRPFDP